MPRLKTIKNSNVFSWGEAYFELCSERPLGLMPSISAALRHAERRLLTVAVWQFHSRSQVAADQAQKFPAADLGAQLRQEFVVVHGIEECF